ncbi:MAG: FtsX-like permease family protein [Gemmatimonadota bacterium]|nr:FtsX-like permease family protein [Gemmatimonadota bacterium]
MRFFLALASLRRNRSRTILAIAGVAIAAALLLDMVMLSGGMRASFGDLLTAQGFQMRLPPRGTLPFDTEATIDGATEIIATLRQRAEIAAVSPVLGAAVRTTREERPVTAFALGIDPTVQGDYRLQSGRDAADSSSIVANDDFLRAAGLQLGDTITLAAGYNPQMRTFTGTRALTVTGRARFLYLGSGQAAVAMPLRTLQAMSGHVKDDAVSVFMVRTHAGSDVEEIARWIQRTVPKVDAVSTAQALARVDERLSYFRQLSFILGAVSLVVGFLLTTTLVTVSVNDRVGEIAVMRAIGISRAHVVHQVLLEGTAISLGGAVLGLGLGLITARWLNTILSSFPGLPAAIDFFLFQPRAAWTALGLLVLSGIAAGVYPAWRAASLPVARTLREEAVA